MLAEAERKGVYRSLVEARLGARLPYDGAAYDAVVSSGVLTTGHAPASSLDELVRDDATRWSCRLHAPLGPDAARLRRDDRRAHGGKVAGSSSSEETSSRRCRRASPEVLVRVWAFRVS